MSEAYVECLVKARKSVFLAVVKVILILVTVYFGMLFFMGNIYALIFAIPALIGSYFAHLYKEVEYEYLYVDKEISIDRILARSRRKKMETLSLDKIEILAPEGSAHLDGYRNRDLKVTRYCAPPDTEGLKRYVMVCGGNRKIVLSLTPKFVDAVKIAAFGKVFTE